MLPMWLLLSVSVSIPSIVRSIVRGTRPGLLTLCAASMADACLVLQLLLVDSIALTCSAALVCLISLCPASTVQIMH